MVNPSYIPGQTDDPIRPNARGGVALALAWLRALWMAGTVRFPRLVRALFVFTLAPVLLYLGVGLAETVMHPSGSLDIKTMATTVPDGADPLELTGFGYGVAGGKRGARTAQLSVNISEFGDRSDARAIYITRVRRAVTAQLNGEPLVSMSGPSTIGNYKVFEPHLFLIPPATEPGTQRLTVDVETLQSQPFVSSVVIDQFEPLERAWSARRFLAISMVIAAVAICALTAMLSFAMSIRLSDRYTSVSFGVLMLSWFGINLTYLGMTSTWPIELSRAFYSAASFTLILASLNYMNEWTFRLTVVRRKVVPFITLALAAKIIPVFFVDSQVYFYVLMSADTVAAGCVAFLLGQMFLYLTKDKDVSILTALIFLICILCVVMDLLYAITPAFGRFLFPSTGITLHYGPIVSALLALTIVGGFVTSFLKSQRALTHSNETLSTRLAEREAEIAKVYAAREIEMRDAALVEERKRIMRDMHDGVGGRLLSLSLRARGDRLKPADMSRELEDSLQELRLIVDSMDTADGDLELALGALRGRLEPALAEAGITLDWNAGELGQQPGYGPQHVLSIYRMVQESVTNLIRHSGADHAIFETALLPDGHIQITISDNGSGLDAGTVREGAKGLRNLRNRAQELGGRVDFVSPPGLAVVIRLPRTPPKVVHAVS